MKTLKVPLPIIAESLQKLPPIPGRFNIFSYKNAKIIVDFAHTPDGLDNLLRTARTLTRGKMITVFGCGGNRDKGKRKKMGEIAARLSDAVIVTEDNSRTEPLTNIISDIMEGVKGNGKVFIVEERREAVEFAASLFVGRRPACRCRQRRGKVHRAKRTARQIFRRRRSHRFIER
ncbi:MAG: hypothetical protein L6V85_06135 [Clostridiales bacterium]|nr:MAG: hypothetical protein L6V85_06135 [Clostridiales bacterium]